jgi:hypothetical protein
MTFSAPAVALRGADDGMTGYAYLTVSGALPFTLNVGTPRAAWLP